MCLAYTSKLLTTIEGNQGRNWIRKHRGSLLAHSLAGSCLAGFYKWFRTTCPEDGDACSGLGPPSINEQSRQLCKDIPTDPSDPGNFSAVAPSSQGVKLTVKLSSTGAEFFFGCLWTTISTQGAWSHRAFLLYTTHDPAPYYYQGTAFHQTLMSPE